MIGAVSSATNGLRLALTSFEKAATSMIASTYTNDQPDAAGASMTDGLSAATVGMVTSRLAFRASLVAAHVANEMLGDLMKVA